MVDITEWKDRAIRFFKSGKATDEHWEVLASCLLHVSETEGLDGDLDDIIDPSSGVDPDGSELAFYESGELPAIDDTVEIAADDDVPEPLVYGRQYIVGQIDGGYLFFRRAEGFAWTHRGYWPTHFALVKRKD